MFFFVFHPVVRSVDMELKTSVIVEMFKVRMQGQYGSPGDKRLATVVSEMWTQWGFRKGIMRGFWVGFSSFSFSDIALRGI